MRLPEAAIPLILRATRVNRVFTSADEARARMAKLAVRPASFAPPTKLRHPVEIDIARHDGWPVYTVRPRSVERGRRLPVIVFVHGGGWFREITTFHWHLVTQLAAEVEAEVVVPIYPLVPFGTAAQALEGVVALVEQALDRTPEVALVGDSAGGQISLSSALALRDRGHALAHVGLISPAVDLTWSNPLIPVVQPTDPWLGIPGGTVFSETWRGELPVTDPAVSPIFGDFAGLGPVTVFSGTRDSLNPDAHVLEERMHEAGVEVAFHEVPGSVHVYPLLPTRTGERGRAQLVEALRTALEPADDGR